METRAHHTDEQLQFTVDGTIRMPTRLDREFAYTEKHGEESGETEKGEEKQGSKCYRRTRRATEEETRECYISWPSHVAHSMRSGG
jgi:hypothetical protein